MERDDVPRYSFLKQGDISGSMTEQCFEEVQRFFEKLTKNDDWFADFEEAFLNSVI